MTLHRWIVAGRVKAPKLRIRNGRAVRLWSKADLARLRKLKMALLQGSREDDRLQRQVRSGMRPYRSDLTS